MLSKDNEKLLESYFEDDIEFARHFREAEKEKDYDIEYSSFSQMRRSLIAAKQILPSWIGQKPHSVNSISSVVSMVGCFPLQTINADYSKIRTYRAATYYFLSYFKD